jgi:EAL domain-containing protein (putative c-di-GMP-specific phosphodiesterase class I)
MAKVSIRNKEENIVLWGLTVRIYGIDEMRVMFGFDQTESALVAIEKEIETIMSKDCFNFYIEDRSNLMFFGNNVDTALEAEYKARNCAELISEVVNRSMQIGNKKIHLKCAVGGLIWRGAETDSESIMMRMYSNMMEALKQGDKIVINQFTGRNVYKGFDVRDLINTGGLTIALQPVIHNMTGQTHFVEAFLRVVDGTRRYAGAIDAVNSACDIGVSIQLDEMVLRMACKEYRRWHEYKEVPEFISINMSKQTLTSEGIAERLSKIAEHEGVSSSRIAIEINGQEIKHKGLDEWKTVCKALKSEGFRVIVDDYDKCEVSGPEIICMDIDVIKIDRDLTRKLSESRKHLKFVIALNDLCRSIGISLVVEGVEEIQDSEALREAGPVLLQGTGLFRPADTLILDGFLNR